MSKTLLRTLALRAALEVDDRVIGRQSGLRSVQRLRGEMVTPIFDEIIARMTDAGIVSQQEALRALAEGKTDVDLLELRSWLLAFCQHAAIAQPLVVKKD